MAREAGSHAEGPMDLIAACGSACRDVTESNQASTLSGNSIQRANTA